MPAVLADAIVEAAHFVTGVHLKGDAPLPLFDVVEIVALRPVVEKRVRDSVVGVVVAIAAEEPESVLEDRPALGSREVGDVFRAVPDGQPAVDQTLGEVVTLPRPWPIGDGGVAGKSIAAFARNHVESDAAARGLRPDGARLIR